MTIPYTYTTTLTATGGQAAAYPLPAPPRGVVTRLVIARVGGTDSFTARLFDQPLAAVASGPLDANGRPVVAAAIGPEVSSSSGTYAAFDLHWAYSVRETEQVRARLWLRLDPAGTGTQTYVVAYTIMAPRL